MRVRATIIAYACVRLAPLEIRPLGRITKFGETPLVDAALEKIWRLPHWAVSGGSFDIDGLVIFL